MQQPRRAVRRDIKWLAPTHLDVLYPSLVVRKVIARESDDLGVPAGELRGQPRHLSELGRANRCVIAYVHVVRGA